MLNEKERKKYAVIENIVNGNITRKEAMVELGLTRQQIYRLIIKYRDEGEQGFSHKGKGKIPVNKINLELIKSLENLYLEKYYDFNFEHFYEEYVFGKYDISYDTILKQFKNDDIISPLAHKNTVKSYKEKMKTVIQEEDSANTEDILELYKSRIIQAEKAHPRRSNNLYVFGQEIQMDACNKIWFGDIPSFLHCPMILYQSL